MRARTIFNVCSPRTLLLITLLSFAGQPALASDLNYTFVEIEYVPDGQVMYFITETDFGGYGIEGSFGIGDTFFLRGSYKDVGTGRYTDDYGDQVTNDLSLFRLGFGAHGEISESLDWVVALDYADFEVDTEDSALPESVSNSESGYIAEVGLRGLLGEAAEYSIAVLQSDHLGGSATGFRAGGRYHFGATPFSVDLEYVQRDSNFNQLELGLRYQFD